MIRYKTTSKRLSVWDLDEMTPHEAAEYFLNAGEGLHNPLIVIDQMYDSITMDLFYDVQMTYDEIARTELKELAAARDLEQKERAELKRLKEKYE